MYLLQASSQQAKARRAEKKKKIHEEQMMNAWNACRACMDWNGTPERLWNARNCSDDSWYSINTCVQQRTRLRKNNGFSF